MKSKRRCDVFIIQCETCTYDQCTVDKSCADCAMYCSTIDTKHDCYCCCDVKDGETSCKYYKAKDGTIKVDDFGTQSFDDTKEKTITFKSPSTAYVDAAEKALFPSLKGIDVMYGSTVDSTIPDKIVKLEKQVDDFMSEVSRLERALNSTTLQLNILLKRFGL